jgi:hypothetical protein
MVDYCHSCEDSGIKTEAGHFVGPKSSRPLLTDKKGRPLCDFHWWLMFEIMPSEGGMSWAEYTRKWTKPDLPKMTWPPKKVQVAELAKLKKR